MRIVIDMQGAQTESRFRGIGRYTLSFAQAVVRNRGHHEVILALSGLFPETIESIRAAFDGLLPQENIRVWHAPGPVREEHPGNDTRRQIAELIREAFLASLQPDLIHICSLFEGYVDDAITSIGQFDRRTPVSVTLYDLIPLLNPDQYLRPNPRYAQYYNRKIQALTNAATLLAISEFSQQEGLAALEKQAQQNIINVSTAIDAHFCPLTQDADTKQQLQQKIKINHPFVLYTGGCDGRKNLPRLIQAYATLPAALRQTHQLVLAGRMPEGEVFSLRHQAQASGLRDGELLFTGYVTDEELVQLYNGCTLFVFPSWHEGFGLPALEAMACGAPVIGANTSSLPEVIGFVEAMFDPFDVSAIARKMELALEDEDFRQRLHDHGLQQAKKFSWDTTAKRAIEAWERLPQKQTIAMPTWQQISESVAGIYRRLVRDISALMVKKSADADDELRQIATCIELNERQIDAYLRPVTLPPHISWRIEGPFDSSYSLALVNREIARALSALGHRVTLHSTEGPGDFLPNQEFLEKNTDLAQMYFHASEVSDPDVVSRNLYPPRVSDMDARFNFLHAYGWEESGFPLEWVEAFNLSLQGMTVMSEHVRKIMIDHGVIIPIEVSSLGIDHWQRVEADKEFNFQAKSFRFLHVSSCFPRKGADVMLRAYGKAFRATDDVTLVIKTFPNPHNEIRRWLDEARANDPDYPAVLILDADYSDAQLKALYEQCHVLVAPSRAEGFGLPMAEAMLSGLAVITTGWSGQVDFCTSETAWLIDYKFAHAKTHFGLSATVWAEPNEKHLVELMREVYEAPKDVRDIRIAAGQCLLKEKFQWSEVAERMVDAARKVARGHGDMDLRIGWVTTWNTRCGIATYSEHLINNMPTKVTVLAAKAASLTRQDEAYARRCWTAGNDDNLTELSQIIDENGINTLVIQFNYGFYNLKAFASFLQAQVDLGRIVVVTMHSTTDPAHDPGKKIEILVPALRRCHRVLVHAPNDMNRLKQLGLVDNISLFPHGIMDYAPGSKLPRKLPSDDDFVIASYGFFLPHKGLLELIDAVSMLRRQGIKVRLEMVNAEYPISESSDLIESACEKIKKLGLSGVVSVHTEFLDDNESLMRLAAADLILFPYQNTGESASGAVRYGIASGRPVAVTPVSIFDDVATAVHMLPGQSVEDVAKGVKFLMQNILSRSDLICDKEKIAERWRAEHRYSRIGPRLYQMLLALNTSKASIH